MSPKMATDKSVFLPNDEKSGEEFWFVVSAKTHEQAVVLREFTRLLKSATVDGGNKRATGVKPPWWKDDAHLPAVFSHINKYFHGEEHDADSGAHPFVHAAWRMLAIAFQESVGKVDPMWGTTLSPERPVGQEVYAEPEQ